VTQKTQDVAANPVVEFQTGRARSASGTCTGYYAGSWRTFQDDVEILPGSYVFSFRDGTANTTYPMVSGQVTTVH